MSDTKSEMRKDIRYKRELKKLQQLFSNLPENEQKFVEPLLQNCAFMRLILEDLQEMIYLNGCIDEYTNGENQGGKKTSAELQSYNATVKNYNTVMDKLIERLPKEAKQSEMAKLMRKYG